MAFIVDCIENMHESVNAKIETPGDDSFKIYNKILIWPLPVLNVIESL